MEKFKFKKRKNILVAFDEKGNSAGQINLLTGVATGGTRCFEALREEREKRSAAGEIEDSEVLQQRLVDAVIERIKEDVASGDLTAIEELLRFCPNKNLKAFLPEELWKDFLTIKA